MKPIIIGTVPLRYMRYDTEGDYFEQGGITIIRTVPYSNPHAEFITAMHELLECYLTTIRGIQEPDVMAFDINSKLDDPGASTFAPYHREHMSAVKLEKFLCREIGIPYKDYVDAEPF